MRNVRLHSRSLGAMLRGYARRHRRRFIVEVCLLAVLVGAVFWAIIDTLELLPPSTATMATGPEGGAYHRYGERYREILAREGFELRLIPTAGAVENLSRLNDTNSGVSIGLLQGGLTTHQNSPGLVSDWLQPDRPIQSLPAMTDLCLGPSVLGFIALVGFCCSHLSDNATRDQSPWPSAARVSATSWDHWLTAFDNRAT